MKIKGMEYGRTFNLRPYESERITLTADLDETEDADEVFRTIKAKVFHLHQEGKLLEESKAAVESSDWLESVTAAFPKDLASLLTFEVSKDATIVKPREFLGSDNFAKIAAVVRNLGGEYISAGKDSHFKILRKP